MLYKNFLVRRGGCTPIHSPHITVSTANRFIMLSEITLDKIQITKISPYENNSRIHSDDQIKRIAKSIQEFGFLNPIILDNKNEIVAGHGRLMAAQLLGMTEVPVILAGHLTEDQKKAYVIADNKLALDSEWNIEMLKNEMDILRDQDFNLNLTGFSLEEIEQLFFEPNFEPATEDEQGDLSKIDAKIVICPKCDHEFNIKDVW